MGLGGCQCKDDYFTADQAKQWAPYAQDDIIGFEIRGGKATDTLRVLSYETETRLYAGTKECDQYSEIIRISLVSDHTFEDTIRFQLINFSRELVKRC